MRNHNDSSYQTLPRNGPLSRSRSQNHYYIQANQFQKRYNNSLYNAYRLKSSRKCPPCCSPNSDRQYQSYMTLNENQNQNQNNTQTLNQYYGDTHFNQNHNQTLNNIQNSKRFIEQLYEQAQINFRIETEKAQSQILTLQNLLQTKNQEIHQLNRQITRLKKISMQSLPSGVNQSYVKPDQASLIQIQNKDRAVKQLERKVNRLRQENSYFRQDLQIKNKQIQQLKQKYKMKQENDVNLKKQLQHQIYTLKEQKQSLLQRNLLAEKIRDSIQKEIQRQKDLHNRIEGQLSMFKIKFIEMKDGYEKTNSKNIDKIVTFQNQFKTIRERSRQKDSQIQSLISKINCVQSELDFFKDKFTNLLFEIEREERQSATIFQQAHSLRENGQRIYEQIQKIRQSQIIQLESHRSSKINENHFVNPVDHRLVQSQFYQRKGLGKQTFYQNYSPKGYNSGEEMIRQSGFDIIQRFPSLNMSISPIRNKK